MTTYTAALEHHVARLRQNPANEYASGAVDALLSLLEDRPTGAGVPRDLEALRRALLAGDITAASVADPLAP